MSETVNIEPHWPGLRDWVKHVESTDPDAAERVAREMGSEAPPVHRFAIERVTNTSREESIPVADVMAYSRDGASRIAANAELVPVGVSFYTRDMGMSEYPHGVVLAAR